MKKVFFFIKNTFRERQWDTVKNINKIILPLYLGTGPLGSSYLYKNYYSQLIPKCKNFIVNNLPLINFKKLPLIHINSDLVYSWGYLPINSKKPFIIEFDNPYVATFYNYFAFKLYKPILKKFFEKAYKLTFMSEASKLNFLWELGENFKEKSVVFYPFVSRKYHLRKKNDKEINFGFIGLDYRLKGLPELLKAFSEIKNQKINLLTVSYIPNDLKQKYSSYKNIIFLSPMKKELLDKNFYSKIDILVLPTFYESFGIVFLEALSWGLGVIGTNVYATPEVIYHQQNGILLDHPFLKPEIYFNTPIVNVTKMRIENFTKKYLKKEIYEDFSENIKKAILEGIDNYKKWQEKSIEIFEEKFSENKWFERAKQIFN